MPERSAEDWLPISPLVGPPLPKWMGITWPWYKEEVPPALERIPIDIIWESAQ